MDTLLGLVVLVVFCYGICSLFQKTKGQQNSQKKKPLGTRYYYGAYVPNMQSMGKFHHHSDSSYPPNLSISKVGSGVNLICEVVPEWEGKGPGYMHLWTIILDESANTRLPEVITYLESLYS